MSHRQSNLLGSLFRKLLIIMITVDASIAVVTGLLAISGASSYFFSAWILFLVVAGTPAGIITLLVLIGHRRARLPAK